MNSFDTLLKFALPVVLLTYFALLIAQAIRIAGRELAQTYGRLWRAFLRRHFARERDVFRCRARAQYFHDRYYDLLRHITKNR